MTELRARGVEFTQGVEDAGWGLVTRFKMPGEMTVQLYQPRYDKSQQPLVGVVGLMLWPRVVAATPRKVSN
jgi:hypothetical protein